MCVPPKGSTHILYVIDIQAVAFHAMIMSSCSGIVGKYRQVVGWGGGGGSKIKKMDQKLRWR